MRAGLCLAALLMSTAAFAQSPSPPGPYVIDLRGVMAGAPDAPFYPAVATTTILPVRGFGAGGGFHLYPLQLGIARVGIGVEGMWTGATAHTPAPEAEDGDAAASTIGEADAAMNVTIISGQVSFNFGTREGWSYLTAGYGTVGTRSEVSSVVPGPVVASVASLTQRTMEINFGGGARWFLSERVAVGFDVRFHRLQDPSKQIVGLSVGVSLR